MAHRMDVIEAHARRLPRVDDRWTVRPHTRDELLHGLRAGKVAGVAAHPLDNVRRNIELLIEQDPDKLFGMTDMPGRFGFDDILDLVEAEAGEPIDRAARSGQVHIAAEPILAACELLGDRLAAAAAAGERVLVATGHPNGLDVLYRELARLLARARREAAAPADGATIQEAGRPGPWRIRYLGDVGLVTDEVAAKHTHAGDAMRRMLRDERPDLVLGDHGYRRRRDRGRGRGRERRRRERSGADRREGPGTDPDRGRDGRQRERRRLLAVLPGRRGAVPRCRETGLSRGAIRGHGPSRTIA